MIPILYDKTETVFTHNGIGFLPDAIECTVTEERNGAYEAVLRYPVDGQYYADITEGSIVKAKANETSDPQLFRVYKSGKPINGIVTYNAEHISYELNGNAVIGFTATGTDPQTAIGNAFGVSVLPCRFTAWSDIVTTNNISIAKPCSLRSLLGGQDGSVLDVWGGEYEFDNFTVKLHAHRGADNGVVIEYGKNLTDINQERNIAECYTHLLPYAVKTIQETDESGAITSTYDQSISLTEKIIAITGAENIGHNKILSMDFTQILGESLDEESLRTAANAYIDSTSLGTPKVNIKASFVQLWQTAEYASIAPLERVKLCDTVTVRFSKLGIEAQAKVIKTVYNSLTEKYDAVELGEAKSNFADTVIGQNNTINNIINTIRTGTAETSAAISNAVLNATNLITGQSGGYVVLNPANNPQEILILDNADINLALNVWRWNSAGLGHSSGGYNGPYTLAMTMDGAIVADTITTGTMSADRIRGGLLLIGTLGSTRFEMSTASGTPYLRGYDSNNVKRVELLSDAVNVYDANGTKRTTLNKDNLTFETEDGISAGRLYAAKGSFWNTLNIIGNEYLSLFVGSDENNASVTMNALKSGTPEQISIRMRAAEKTMQCGFDVDGFHANQRISAPEIVATSYIRVGPSWKKLVIDRGTATINCVANTTTSTRVYFTEIFEAPPIVTVTVRSANAYQQIKAVSIGTPTTTYVDIYLLRTDTVDTAVCWTATSP